MRWIIAIMFTWVWLFITTTTVISHITRYSPLWSWQTAVVFGGALVVFIVSYWKAYKIFRVVG